MPTSTEQPVTEPMSEAEFRDALHIVADPSVFSYEARKAMQEGLINAYADLRTLREQAERKVELLLAELNS